MNLQQENKQLKELLEQSMQLLREARPGMFLKVEIQHLDSKVRELINAPKDAETPQ